MLGRWTVCGAWFLSIMAYVAVLIAALYHDLVRSVEFRVIRDDFPLYDAYILDIVDEIVDTTSTTAGTADVVEEVALSMLHVPTEAHFLPPVNETARAARVYYNVPEHVDLMVACTFAPAVGPHDRFVPQRRHYNHPRLLIEIYQNSSYGSAPVQLGPVVFSTSDDEVLTTSTSEGGANADNGDSGDNYNNNSPRTIVSRPNNNGEDDDDDIPTGLSLPFVVSMMSRHSPLPASSPPSQPYPRRIPYRHALVASLPGSSSWYPLLKGILYTRYYFLIADQVTAMLTTANKNRKDKLRLAGRNALVGLYRRVTGQQVRLDVVFFLVAEDAAS